MLNQQITDCVEQADKQQRFVPVTELFEHVKDNSRLIKGLMSSDSTDLLLDKIKAYWNNKIEQYLKGQLSGHRKSMLPLTLLTNHITSTMFELLKWWINNNMPYSPQQMDEYFQALINPCIPSFLYDKKTTHS